jgi:hypothetical protein
VGLPARVTTFPVHTRVRVRARRVFTGAMDLNWCTVCGRHTSGDLYCSSICLARDGGAVAEVDCGLGAVLAPPPTPTTAATSGSYSPPLSRRPVTARWHGRWAAAPGEVGAGLSLPLSAAEAAGAGGDGSPRVAFPSLVAASARGQSPPSPLLDEIRQYRHVRQQRDLPRRRGLPFWEEVKAEWLLERRRAEDAERALLQSAALRMHGRYHP